MSKTEKVMALRIKELCREKHITMKEIAEKLGINPITLSQSLSGNPTLSRLTEVADILGVDVSELFEHHSKSFVYGCLYIDGEPVLVKSKEDLFGITESLKILDKDTFSD